MPYSIVYGMVHNSEWQPDWIQLRALLEFLGVDRFETVHTYAGPLFWDGNERSVLSSARDATLEQAMALVTKKTITVFLYCNLSNWADRLGAELETVDQELSDGYVAWSLSLYLGPYSIPDRYQERTERVARFTISLGGDGSPTDNSEYLNVVRQTQAWKELANFIQNWAASPLNSYLVVG